MSDRDLLRKGKNFLARDRTVDLWLSSSVVLEGFLDFLDFGAVVRGLRSVNGCK